MNSTLAHIVRAAGLAVFVCLALNGIKHAFGLLAALLVTVLIVMAVLIWRVVEELRRVD